MTTHEVENNCGCKLSSIRLSGQRRLLSEKTEFLMAPWNVRTSDNDWNICKNKRLRIDVLEISKVRWLEGNNLCSGDYKIIYKAGYGGQRGVGALVLKVSGKRM